MATLAQLKRDLTIGQCLTQTSFHGKTEGKNIGVPRFIVKKNTQGICLNEDKTAARGSYLDYPPASFMEFDGETIKIYNSGSRPLTEEEKRILKEQPRDDKQDSIDMMTDGSTMFHRRKSYFQKSGKYYLFGVSIESGKRLITGTRQTLEDGSFSDWKVEDNKCKGEVVLTYDIS